MNRVGNSLSHNKVFAVGTVEMLPNSLRTRGVMFAYLFGPPRFVDREEAMKVHGAVCDKLGHDDFSFQYSTSENTVKPSSKGFSIELKRKEGRGSVTVLIDNNGVQQPVRLLITYLWPPSMTHVEEDFDLISEAVFNALDGEWQKVHAEVRIRAQCDTSQKDGLGFIKHNLLAVDEKNLEALGKPLVFAGVRFEVAPSVSSKDPLTNPKREIDIQLLKEDPQSVYLELVSLWRQFPEIVPSTGVIRQTELRQIVEEPSAYVKEAYVFLRDRVASLSYKKGDEK